ncbi:MAG TPA: hypothetical protein VKU90_05025 [Caulobacteraceae bacterium]|nr:hypothetical protein [Caulobacteraceae bacterium]
MSGDFGVRRGRRRGVSFHLLLAVVGAPVLMTAALGVWLLERNRAIEEAAAWTFTGPACRALTAAEYQARPSHPMPTFSYENVGFGRAYGHASCNNVVNDGGRGFGTFPECQFTSADLLKITTAKGDFYFSVGSHPATVAVHRDTPSCVMAGSFTGAGGPGADTAVGASGG